MRKKSLVRIEPVTFSQRYKTFTDLHLQVCKYRAIYFITCSPQVLSNYIGPCLFSLYNFNSLDFEHKHIEFGATFGFMSVEN